MAFFNTKRGMVVQHEVVLPTEHFLEVIVTRLLNVWEKFIRDKLLLCLGCVHPREGYLVNLNKIINACLNFIWHLFSIEEIVHTSLVLGVAVFIFCVFAMKPEKEIGP